jgi:hypothetical protein
MITIFNWPGAVWKFFIADICEVKIVFIQKNSSNEKLKTHLFLRLDIPIGKRFTSFKLMGDLL